MERKKARKKPRKKASKRVGTDRVGNASDPDHVGGVDFAEADFELIFSDVFSAEVDFGFVSHVQVVKTDKRVRITLISDKQSEFSDRPQ